MKHYTKNNHPVQKCHATVIGTSEQSYTPVPGYEPSRPLYEIQFETPDGPLSFEVSRFAFPLLESGMKGELVWQGPDIISFEPWIQ